MGKSIFGVSVRRAENARGKHVAVYSECGKYRFYLRRQWERGRLICFLMLNPSTATELANDPTVERCERRARAMGFGGFIVVNLFAWRATNPADMKRQADPVGEWNNLYTLHAAAVSAMTVCAWGSHGGHLGRDKAVLAKLEAAGIRPYALRLTKGGAPSHPLYVPYDVVPRMLAGLRGAA